MAKQSIGPMILAAAILAAPALAVGQGTTSPSSPGASPPSSSMGAGMTGSRSGGAAGPSAAAPAPVVPRYATSDGQMRVGKLVGASVYNDQNQSVGSIDDVLMSHDNKATMAVISVGGFLGMGAKLVSVPFDQLKVGDDRIVMPGATTEALKGMPEYKYSKA